LILFLIPSFVHGQEIPEEFYETLQLYDHKISNEQMAISSDNSKYEPGDNGILIGLVYASVGSGDRVFIKIIGPDNSIISEINVALKSDGTFKVQQQIPEEATPGKYIIEARYTESGLPVSLEIRLIDPDPDSTLIEIPFGASSQESGLNFSPKNVKVKSHIKLVWTNNDFSVHTVVSGKEGIGNKMFSDGKFDSGIISPETTFELILEEGVYNYFCRLHPWLQGSIDVSPSSKPSPTLETPIEKQEADLFLLTDAETTTSWSFKTCTGCSANITLSSDKKEGFSSVVLKAEGSQYASGPKNSFEFTFEPVNINNYERLNFWIKTKGSVLDFSRLGLVDTMGKSRVLMEFHSTNFPVWTSMSRPIDHTIFQDKEFNEKSVTGFFIKTPEGSSMKSKQIQIFLDDINLKSKIVPIKQVLESQFLTLFTNKKSYLIPETISVNGTILSRESDIPVTFQVFNPKNELIQIDQIVPNMDNTFNFTLSTAGNRFKDEGKFSIVAQYGVLEHKTEVFFTLKVPEKFPVSNNVLLEIWNSRPNLQEDYPEVADGNLERFKEWAQTTGWNWHESLSPLIPKGQTPQYLLPPPEKFPVSDEVLLEIWNKRPNLQEDYPEVADGNLERFKEWAQTTGWNWHESLSPLIPQGQTPQYLLELDEDEVDYTILILVISFAAIAGISYFVFIRKSKSS